MAKLLDDVVDTALRRHGAGRCSCCVIHADVARACACSAAGLADALRDPQRTIGWPLVIEVRAFLTDGCTSPLFGDAANEASCVLAELERRADEEEQ
jgi:hypothetical protein